MAIKEVLDSVWNSRKISSNVLTARDEANKVLQYLASSVAVLDKLQADAKSFEGVGKELTDEIAAVNGVLKAAKTEMEKHLEFLQWKKPAVTTASAVEGLGPRHDLG